jgi:hypothetical protein
MPSTYSHGREYEKGKKDTKRVKGGGGERKKEMGQKLAVGIFQNVALRIQKYLLFYKIKDQT